MILTAIDPGTTTGMFIADVHVMKSTCAIVPLTLVSEPDTNRVYQLLGQFQPWAVVMEDTAIAPSREGLAPWEIIWNGLIQLGFHRIKGIKFRLVPRGISLISPGVWKPVMKTQSINWGDIHPNSQHEKDAVMLMHYWLRVNYSQKEIEYVTE